MRALWRHRLASLVVSASILFTGLPAYMAVAAATHPSVPMAACPPGTNWENGQCT